MKRQYKSLSIILVCALLTACSADEPGQLPSGKYPLKVTATVDAPQSRSIGKDSWIGDGTEMFGVRIGSDARVAKYVITDASGKAEAVSGTTPLYWDNTDKATVSAWLPYDTQTDVDISDQSAGFARYDYLAANADGQSYIAPVKLQFTHQMAKVRCVLKPGKGITEADLSAAKTKIAGYTSATFTEGTLTGNGDGWITPTSDGEVLLVPQDMTGKRMFQICVSDKEFIYIPDTEAAGDLQAGYQYSYTITVKKDGLEVTSVTASDWMDKAETGDGTEDKAFLYVSIPDYDTSGLSVSSNAQRQDDGSFKVTGYVFTLTCSVNDTNRYKGFSIMSGKGQMVRTINDAHNQYTFTCTLQSDVQLKYGEYIGVGDFFYDDLTCLPYLDDTTTCKGIVFKVGAGEDDKADYYESKLSQIHGYAVALHDAIDEYNSRISPWTIGERNYILCGTSRSRTDYLGYYNTLMVRSADNYNELYSNGKYIYRVGHAVDNYGFATAAPDGTSGWYLPSCGQMYDIVTLWKDNAIIFQRLKALLNAEKYKHDWILPYTDHGYATSTETSDYYIYRVEPNGKITSEPKNYFGNFAVRPVLTF